MSTPDILEEALRLPRNSRALIAEKLLESLDLGDDFDVSEEWRNEITVRCEQIDNETVKLIPSARVFDEVLEGLP